MTWTFALAGWAFFALSFGARSRRWELLACAFSMFFFIHPWLT